jgi:anion-transporting  ArsA/GET3 family ATPase
VGKTFLSSTLACKIKEKYPQKRVLVCENSFVGQILPLFGFDSFRKGFLKTIFDDLDLINLDPEECFKTYIVDYLKQKILFEKVFSHRAVKSFISVIPGLYDVILLGHLYYLLEVKKSYDHIIFDGPASGHFLNMIKTPKAIIDAGLIGPLISDIEKIKNYLESQNTTIWMISLAKQLVTRETLEFFTLLNTFKANIVSGVICNRSLSAFDAQIPASLSKNVKDYLISSYKESNFYQKSLFEGLASKGFKGAQLSFMECGAVVEPVTSWIKNTNEARFWNV